jgi:phosphate transport system permease protein
MPGYIVLAVIALIGLAGYVFGSRRAVAQRSHGTVSHSLPAYHGWLTFILAVVPAVVALLLWSLGSSLLVERTITTGVPAGEEVTLASGMVRSVGNALDTLGLTGDTLPKSYQELAAQAFARGMSLPGDGADYMVPLADLANQQERASAFWGAAIAVILAAIGATYGYSRIAPRARARNQVETVMLWVLVGASTVAILTTVGIVLSMLGETLRFFSEINPLSFFFGTVWDPRFSAAGSGEVGQFGLVPLLAGTLYIAFVSMLVAVPIGLMAAVYMGEYASRQVRSTVKPLLELLAGIPTIVYGIFAVVTLGPFLRDLSAALSGGTGFIQAQSVFTAGLIMGVMLIPVVSSLSDDVITAVPRAMRDGSLAIGATRSETIKRVILPAALPGIVGALL